MTVMTAAASQIFGCLSRRIIVVVTVFIAAMDFVLLADSVFFLSVHVALGVVKWCRAACVFIDLRVQGVVACT